MVLVSALVLHPTNLGLIHVTSEFKARQVNTRETKREKNMVTKVHGVSYVLKILLPYS